MSLQQSGVDVEDVSRICLAARRPSQEERELPIGPGVPGEVVVHDQNVVPAFHEVLGHRGGGVGSDELATGWIIAGCDDDGGVAHRSGLSKVCDRLGDTGAALPDGAVDAHDPLVALVDDRVDGDGRLACLPVTQDELALSPTDRHERVDRLDPGLERRVDGCPLHDVGGGPLDRPLLLGGHGTTVVERTPRGIDHSSDDPRAYRGAHHQAGPTDGVPCADSAHRIQEDDTDPVRRQVVGHADVPVREAHQFLRTHPGQSPNLGDSAIDTEHPADLLDLRPVSVGPRNLVESGEPLGQTGVPAVVVGDRTGGRHGAPGRKTASTRPLGSTMGSDSSTWWRRMSANPARTAAR